MKETNFSVALTQKSADFSRPYMEIKDKVEQVPFRDITAVGPAGSINSNVLDMAQWVLLNLNKGKFGDKQIVSEASMAQIHSPQMLIPMPIRYDEVLYSSYGMGWVIEPYRGHLLVWHNGGIDGFISQVAFLPRENAGLVILSNLNDNPVPGIVYLNIVDRLLGLDQVDWNKRIKDGIAKGKAEDEKARKEEDKDRKLDTQPSHPLADYVGDYENPGYGTVSVVKDGDGLKLKTPLLEGPLSHYHYDVFELKAMLLGSEQKSKVAFATDSQGQHRQPLRPAGAFGQGHRVRPGGRQGDGGEGLPRKVRRDLHPFRGRGQDRPERGEGTGLDRPRSAGIRACPLPGDRVQSQRRRRATASNSSRTPRARSPKSSSISPTGRSRRRKK